MNLKKQRDSIARRPSKNAKLSVSVADEPEFGYLVQTDFEIGSPMTSRLGKEAFELLSELHITERLRERRLALERFIRAALELSDLKIIWDADTTKLTEDD